MVWFHLLRGLGLVSNKGTTPKQAGTVHDYTVKLSGQDLTLVKPLDGGVRVFMVGFGAHPVVGDLIVTKGNKSLGRVRYRIEKIKYGEGGTWRAYGRLEHRHSSVVKTRYGHPRSTVSVV